MKVWSMFVLAAFALLTVAWGQAVYDLPEPRFTANHVDKVGMFVALDEVIQKLDHLQETVDALTRKTAKLQRAVDSLTVLVDTRTALPDDLFHVERTLPGTPEGVGYILDAVKP